MKKTLNRENISGRVYQHNLVVKQVKNQSSANYGKDFISGDLDIAVDEAGMNVVTVHYTYEPANNKNGSNSKFQALKKIIESGKTWITDGKDAATKVRIESIALDLNDFVSSRDGSMVAAKRNEGGFITIVNELPDEDERNKFEVDMVITSVKTVEADEERHIDKAYDVVKGAIFNFRNEILPMDFVVRSDGGMQYFESLDASASNPIFTKVWGKIISTTVKTEISEESAFGEASVRTVERKTKEWCITGTAKIPYDFGDETVLTGEELTKAMQDREVKLATVKKEHDEFAAQKAGSTSSPAVAAVAQGTFNF
jgi:hypothetical protein